MRTLGASAMEVIYIKKEIADSDEDTITDKSIPLDSSVDLQTTCQPAEQECNHGTIVRDVNGNNALSQSEKFNNTEILNNLHPVEFIDCSEMRGQCSSINGQQLPVEFIEVEPDCISLDNRISGNESAGEGQMSDGGHSPSRITTSDKQSGVSQEPETGRRSSQRKLFMDTESLAGYFIKNYLQNHQLDKESVVSFAACRRRKISLSTKQDEAKERDKNEEKKKKKNSGKRGMFACFLCDYSCAFNSLLQRHMLSHTGEKPLSCTECNFKCATSSHLNRHKKIHSGEKPYSCKLCDYKCARSSHLTQHETTHSGKKPYSCAVCDYRCARPYDLSQHNKVHTGQKPYSCTMCDYRCNRPSHLTQHARSHTGEKPYQCTVCEYRCTSISGLISHKKIHTLKKPSDCS